MDRRNFEVEGITISCLVHGRAGPAIVFLHGNSLSSESFLRQLEAPELRHFHMVSIDFPGHGASMREELPERNYHLFRFRDIVLGVLKQMGINSYMLVGHSLGGHVAMECLEGASGCRGILISGAPPISLEVNTTAIFTNHPLLGLLFKPELSEEEVSALASVIAGEEWHEEIAAMFSRTDPTFRTHFPASFSKGYLSDEYQLLKTSGLPVAILHGDKDALINYQYYGSLDLPMLWHSKPVIVDSATHSPQLENPREFNRILHEFYSEIFQPV